MGEQVVKGTRIRVVRYVAEPLGTYSLAGQQAKIAATRDDFNAIVRHIYGDHPDYPTKIELVVEREDTGKEIGISPEMVSGVIRDE